MITNKMSLLNLLSSWPIIGKRCRASVVKHTLEQFDEIVKGFDSPSIRFSHNIHALHHVLQGFDYFLTEDLSYFKSVRLNLFTKTSAMACEWLDILELRNGLPEIDKYEHDGLSDRFLDWYSSQETLGRFIGNTIQLIDIYVAVNPMSEEGIPKIFNPGEITFNTKEFIGGRYFKLFVLDLIRVLKVLLYLEQRGDHEQKS